MRKVVHRDLKLENILLSDKTPQAKVKIADFGLARFFADDSELRTICGSPLYVAPEILDIGTSSETVTFHICGSNFLPNYMQRQNM